MTKKEQSYIAPLEGSVSLSVENISVFFVLKSSSTFFLRVHVMGNSSKNASDALVCRLFKQILCPCFQFKTGAAVYYDHLCLRYLSFQRRENKSK